MYRGRLPGTENPQRKLTYGRHVADWDWFVATGVFLIDIEDAFRANLINALALCRQAGLAMLPTIGRTCWLPSMARIQKNSSATSGFAHWRTDLLDSQTGPRDNRPFISWLCVFRAVP